MSRVAESSSSGSVPDAAQSGTSKYRFYKPKTWFNPPTTGQYTKFDPAPVAARPDEPAALEGNDAEGSRHGPLMDELWVWHGSFKRWRKRHVSAEKNGLLIITRSRKSKWHAWTFSLHNCTVLLDTKHPRQLAVSGPDGRLYLRTLQEQRLAWSQAITASAVRFQRQLNLSGARQRVGQAAQDGAAAQSEYEAKIDRQVKRIVDATMLALQPPMLAVDLAFGLHGAGQEPSQGPASTPSRTQNGHHSVHASPARAPSSSQHLVYTQSSSVDLANLTASSQADARVAAGQLLRSPGQAGSKQTCQADTGSVGSLSSMSGLLHADGRTGEAVQSARSLATRSTGGSPQPGSSGDVRPGASGADPQHAWVLLPPIIRSVVTNLAARIATLEVEASELEDALQNRSAAANHSFRPPAHADAFGWSDGSSTDSGAPDYSSATSSFHEAMQFGSSGRSGSTAMHTASSTLARTDERELGRQGSDALAALVSVRTIKFLESALQTDEVLMDKTAALASGPAPTTTESEVDSDEAAEEAVVDAALAEPRARLPHPAPLSMGISIWGILKSAIGKDLSKITLPATINEPASALQRLAEDMEEVSYVSKACTTASPAARMLWMTLFATAPVNSAIPRDRKPFNPLLGETFEWTSVCGQHRLLAEQVSHHPPIACLHAAGPGYSLLGELQMVSSFWGKSIQLRNEGGLTAALDNGETYAWKKPVFTINNLILGKPWIEAVGNVDVACSNGYCASVNLFKCKGNLERRGELTGEVRGPAGETLYALAGSVMSTVRATALTQAAADGLGCKLGDEVVVFSRAASVADGPANYNMTRFAIGLNDPHDPCLAHAAPTDSRLRPDMQALENGMYDMSTAEKLRLEDKQRKAAGARKARGEKWTPLWFDQVGTSGGHLVKQTSLGPHVWRFNGAYWHQQASGQWPTSSDLY